jgi:hypothetical protein
MLAHDLLNCLVACWFLMPDAWFLMPGSWFLMPGSWFLMPGSWRAAKSRALSDSGENSEMFVHNIKGEKPARASPTPRAEVPSSSVAGNGQWGRTRAGP